MKIDVIDMIWYDMVSLWYVIGPRRPRIFKNQFPAE